MSSVRFTEQEKIFLVEAVSEHKDVLENKRTDGTTLKKKNAAWEEIEALHSSQGFAPKTTKQLRKCWESIKQRTRQQNTVERQNRLSTGGGPPKIIKKGPLAELVAAAITNLDVTLLHAVDSDAVYHESYGDQAQSADTESPKPSCTPENDSRKRSNEEDEPAAKRTKCGCKDKLIQLHLQKAEEAILHQRELHQKRLLTADMELRIAALKMKQLEENGP